jgi:hypothetical protein
MHTIVLCWPLPPGVAERHRIFTSCLPALSPPPTASIALLRPRRSERGARDSARQPPEPRVCQRECLLIQAVPPGGAERQLSIASASPTSRTGVAERQHHVVRRLYRSTAAASLPARSKHRRCQTRVTAAPHADHTGKHAHNRLSPDTVPSREGPTRSLGEPTIRSFDRGQTTNEFGYHR